jgi:hypothetical protein
VHPPRAQHTQEAPLTPTLSPQKAGRGRGNATNLNQSIANA